MVNSVAKRHIFYKVKWRYVRAPSRAFLAVCTHWNVAWQLDRFPRQGTTTAQSGGTVFCLDVCALRRFMMCTSNNYRWCRNIGSWVPEYFGKKSKYTEGTDFLGTPKDHQQVLCNAMHQQFALSSSCRWHFLHLFPLMSDR